MSKLYLVDGFALAFRAYYAMISRPLINSRGENTQAVHNFFRMLFRAIRQEKPENLVVVFDSRGKTFRHQLYPEYKANRVKTPEDLLVQLPWIIELTELFGIPHVSQEGLEADDLIADFVFEARKTGQEVRILSGDKDLMQLVDEGVRLLVPSRDPMALFDEFGPDEVKEKFGVFPLAIPDYLAIVGDSSDNVPGVRGLGDKGARALLARWESLEAIYQNLDEVSPESARRKLEAGREAAYLSYRLVKLLEERPALLRGEETRFAGVKGERALSRLEALELKQLLGEIRRHGWLADEESPKSETSELELFSLRAPDSEEATETPLSSSETLGCQWLRIQNLEELDQMIKEIREAGRVALDSETTGLELYEAGLLGLSFAIKPHQAWFVPIGGESGLDEQEVLTRLKPLLEDPAIEKIGQNLKFDYGILALRGIRLAGITFDTMLAGYLLDPGSRVNLESLAARYLEREIISYRDLVKAKGGDLTASSIDEVTAYAAEDAEVCLSLASKLEPLLKAADLEPVFKTIELPLIKVLAEMELAGVRLDSARLGLASQKLGQTLADLESAIFAAAGQEFNLNSPKQLSQILFEELGLPVIKKTKTGYSTNEEVLLELAPRHEVPRLILEYRKAYKLKNTYLDPLPSLVSPLTGRIHTSFNQAVTATGRLSSSEPNLQNIPVRDEAGRELRQAFIPAAGHRLIGADYSQIELRVLAALSRDPALTLAYQNGEDIHTRTASSIFGIDQSAVDRTRRGIAKAINFGVIYGQTAFGLSREIGITRGEADNFIRAWFEVYSGVREYSERVIQEAGLKGEVRTWFGRLRKIPQLASQNKNLRQLGERLAINTLIQGTAADLIKLAMRGVATRLASDCPEARLVLQVHDELLVEAPHALADQARAILIEEMSRPWPFELPLEIDARIGENWDQVH